MAYRGSGILGRWVLEVFALAELNCVVKIAYRK